VKSAPHPPYSPDLAPSDFYLFGYIKRCLAGLSFEDADRLLAAVEGVLEGIEKATLQSGLSRVDGPIKEMYCYQWGVY
jgi:histone-lysine N-methyltransferase SETMAR